MIAIHTISISMVAIQSKLGIKDNLNKLCILLIMDGHNTNQSDLNSVENRNSSTNLDERKAAFNSDKESTKKKAVLQWKKFDIKPEQ